MNVDSYFLEIIEKDESYKQAFNILEKDFTKQLEKRFTLVLLNEFLINTNTMLKQKYPSLKTNLFSLDGLNVWYNYKQIFFFDPSISLGEQLVKFKETENQFVLDAINDCEKWEVDFSEYKIFIENAVKNEISKNTETNYISKLMSENLSFKHYYLPSSRHKGQYTTYLYMDESPMILEPITDFSIDKKEEYIKAIESKLSKIYSDKFFKYTKELSDYFNKVGFKNYIFLSYKNDNSASHRYRSNGIVEIGVSFAVLSDEEKTKLVSAFKNYQIIIQYLKEFYARFSSEFTFIDDLIDNKMYLLDKGVISTQLNTESVEYENFKYEIKTLLAETQKRINDFINSEALDLPELPLNLNRYTFYKTSEYKVGNDEYIVFAYKGKIDKLKYKTFKNGNALSRNQQSKAYQEYKALFVK